MKIGDILYCKIPFENGSITPYPRFYVVVEITDHHTFYCLNMSSIRGKEWKLYYPSNKEIFNCIPPMRKRTMVKLDEEYEIEMTSYAESKIFDSFDDDVTDQIEQYLCQYLNRQDTSIQISRRRIID